ncbi:penicillin-binding transpeptidase domain-containing protein [Iamia sp. SCSIO 61187]|uniref:penicillin-binding transpeptidase domain-containing protein n=1 Tax=Iamia sp. SCSIO 61187 TaxID=2722752 RepID=UPI002102AA73|nr:penicillin-binding transpeptidase domain-containing protein [Iamia sp. SCSIO 61187]
MVGILGVLVVVALAVAAVVVLTQDDEGGGGGGGGEREAATAAVARFVEAVNAGTPGEGGTVQPAAEVDAAFTALTEGLGTVTVEATAGDVSLAEDEDSATAPLTAVWSVEGATWDTSGTVTATIAGAEGEQGEWKVLWDVAALDNRLRAGDSLSVTPTQPGRAPILDGAGEPLVAPTPVVVVGVVPGDVPDTLALADELARLLDLDAAELAGRIDATPDDQFLEIITLRRSDYDPIRDQLQPLPGTRFREEEALLPPSRTFARPLLGTVGPADEEDVAESEGRLELGEPTGQGGVQGRYDEQLSGTPGLEIRVSRPPADAPPDGSSSTATTEPAPPTVETLEQIDPTPGTPVRMTLDRAAQEAAEAALAGDPRLTALVAVRVSTSEVLAAATGPTGSAQNIAFNGQVAPGSTFKVVSSLAHIRRGLTPDQIVPCPATATAGGQPFRNAGGFVLGDVPFREDFAASCNTAFVNLSADLEPGDLGAAGAAFGLGAEWDVGLGSFNGSVPPFESAAEAGAASIGQGRVQASPLSMAMVAATVAAGRWKAPRVIAEPAAEDPPAEIPLDPTEAGFLRDMMRAVVVDGTATGSLGGLPGEVFAKTGTAEFGSGEDLQTNAWIIGWRDDVAFCVFVEGGAGGGSVAGPIAAAFLNAYGG